MESNILREDMAMLYDVIGKPLCYAIKSPDIDLFDLGFGLDEESWIYALHATCPIKVIRRNGSRQVECYFGDTTSGVFASGIHQVIGVPVKRVALSTKNDLWLDFGDWWVVAITIENGEESWRFIDREDIDKQVIASNIWIEPPR